MKPLQIHRDTEGRPHLTEPLDVPLLGDFLETEIDENAELCATLQGLVTEFLADSQGIVQTRRDHEFAGNLYLLTITPESARLENLQDENVPSVEITLPTFERVLGEWLAEITETDPGDLDHISEDP